MGSDDVRTFAGICVERSALRRDGPLLAVPAAACARIWLEVAYGNIAGCLRGELMLTLLIHR